MDRDKSEVMRVFINNSSVEVDLGKLHSTEWELNGDGRGRWLTGDILVSTTEYLLASSR